MMKILGEQKIDFAQKYRLLHYIITVNVETGVLLRNQLTYEMILLDNTEYSLLVDSKPDDSSSFSNDLIKRWFLVPVEFDEYNIKQQVLSILPLLQKSTSKRTYSILTTLDCNARCFYCFENDTPKYAMSDDTADKVIEYIKSTYNNESIAIQWFGGEPLYNIEAIDRIILGIKKHNIDFVSTMTSNGYLFDSTIVDRAKKLWKLKRVQITLDGTEKTYNKVKNYIYNTDDSPFYRVIRNIHLLLDAEILVNIRLNIERYNIEDIYKLIDQLDCEFNKNKFLHIYPAILFDDCKVNLKTRDEEMNNKLLEESIRIKTKLYTMGYYKDRLDKSPRINSCMADNDNTIIILPNGNLSKCERITQENRLGSVYERSTNHNLISEWKEVADFNECKFCPIGIECKHLKKCPSWGHHGCGANTQRTIIISKQFAMKNQYDKFLKESERAE